MKRSRVIILAACAAMFVCLEAMAVPTPPSANQDAKKAPAIVRAAEIRIPPDCGRITDRFDSGGDKLVIHMQDAHTNYEAQKNAATILEDLINRYGLYLIFVEGGSRDVTLNRYREQLSLDERKKMGEESLKNGTIAGEEYLNIVSDYPMKLQGIEDRAVYDQNMTAFLGADKERAAAILFTGMLTNAVLNLKPKIYSKALKELDDNRIRFKEEKLPLPEYVKYLSDLARSKKINMSPYQNYKNLIDSVELEKTIDFTEVEKERAEVIDILSKKLDQTQLNELLTKSVDFKEGKITQGQYHIYLNDLMAKWKVDIKKYPNLEKYVAYISMYEKIDSPALFREIKLMQSAVEQAVATNEEQRRLVDISKNLELLIEYINLKIGPDDFEYYRQHEADFNVAVWVRFLNDQSAKYKLTQRLPENTQAIEKIMPYIKEFYVIARKRDDIFLNNTKKYMDEEGVNIAALIAGGFHTSNLMKLFRENKVSYVVIAPKVSTPTDEKLYHKILTEGWAPAEGAAPAGGTTEEKK